MARVKNSAVVARQLPEHIREDYPTFVAFVEAYYEFLQSQNVDLNNARDIDSSLDGFIDQFKKELAYNLPVITQNEPFLLQKIKDLYLAKGSEASYKLLFRILFGKEVDIFYPGQQMLRASDGRWNQEISIFVRVDFGDVDNVIGRIVDVQTPTRIIKVLVDRKQNLIDDANRVAQVDPNNQIYELFLDKNFFGTIKPGDVIRFNDSFQATILPTTSNIVITQPGRNFKIGQVFELGSLSGTRALLKVTGITDDGGIRYAELIKFGVGYVANFANTILAENTINSRLNTTSFSSTLVQDLTYESSANGTISASPSSLVVTGNLTSFGTTGNPKPGDELWTTEEFPKLIGVVKSVESESSLTLATFATDYNQGTAITENYVGSFVFRNNDRVGDPYEVLDQSTFTYSSNIRDSLLGFDEQGYINFGDYVDSDFVDGTYVGTITKEFVLSFRNAQETPEQPAIISVQLDAVARYPGFFETNSGFLNDSIVIQDSRYYQIFSYVIKIDERLNSYKSAVKSMIHPTGLALFGEFNITNNYNLSLGVEALAVSLGIRVRDDFITEIDSADLTVGKVLSSDISSIESDIVNFIFGKSLSSQFSQEEQTTFLVTKNFISETPALQDSLNLEYSTDLTSDQQFTDQLSLDVTSLLASDVSLEDNISVSILYEEELLSSTEELIDTLSLNVDKQISSEVAVSEVIQVATTYSFETEFGTQDNLTFEFNANLSQEVSVNDSVTISIVYEEELLSSTEELIDTLSLNVDKQISSEVNLTDDIQVAPTYILETDVGAQDALTFEINTVLSQEVLVDENISLESTKYEEDTLLDQQNHGYVQFNPYYGQDYVTFNDTYSEGSRDRIFPEGYASLEGDLMTQDGEEDLQTLDGEVDLNV
jgi:hypothetical protein